MTKRRILCVGKWLALVAVATMAVWYFLPKPPLLDGVQFSQRILDRDGRLLRVALTPDDKYRVFSRLDEISPELIAATLHYEDRYFEKHPGVNPVALARSAARFSFNGRARLGASTITMQVARMRIRLNTRTLAGKTTQVVRALELERHYSKPQILEAYFNLAPYGRNVEGAAAASLIYFGKPTAKLSGLEAGVLSVIPQSPQRRAPQVTENESLREAHQRSSAGRRVSAGAESFLTAATRRGTMLAPHFTTEILQQQLPGDVVTTTLDLDLQRLVERQITRHTEQNRAQGIVNAAALLVNFRTNEVLAQVGSANFFDESIAGQVDGTRCRRSPGSTLKPFVYALAMDAGLIHPLTTLADAPRRFGEFNPENFDRDFVGPISATEALARSRNLPAVALAAKLSRPTLYQFLKRAGVALPHDENFYGLALPLGGAEVTMEELARLYSMLANHGRARPLQRILAHAEIGAGTRVLSAEASFLALEMLGNSSRPGLGGFTGGEGIYWKTGTSHGFHDAWSVAVFDDFVLAVWVGNFDGRANPALVGRTAAAPLLFQIIDGVRALDHVAPKPIEPPAGANLRRVEFCAVSGQIPTRLCAHRVSGSFIPGVSPIAACAIHREVLVDAASGLRVRGDDGTRTLRREVYEFWPAELVALFNKTGLHRRLPPAFVADENEDISRREGAAPRILSPALRLAYALSNSRRTVPLKADADADVETVYWFADKAFVGESGTQETLPWSAPPGVYKIVAIDDHGRSASRSVRIEAVP